MDSEGRSRKKDRSARLVLIERILSQYPHGISVKGLAQVCDVTPRTIYRDLAVIEGVLGVAVWEKGAKRGVFDGQYLTPIRFSVIEALNLFLALRLTLRYANRYVPNIASTFIKINSVVPSPLREQVTKSVVWMHSLPANENYQRTMLRLAEAWISQRKARISYCSLRSEKSVDRTIEPYFIEPAAPDHSSYVIAYCHRAGELRTFKMERIESIHLTDERYVVPSDFDINDYFGSSFGIVVEGDLEPQDIKLKFLPQIARIISEPVWHPSQVLEPQDDGSLIMRLRVANTIDLYRWILKWGDQVEVLEPEELRNELANTVRSMLQVYNK